MFLFLRITKFHNGRLKIESKYMLKMKYEIII